MTWRFPSERVGGNFSGMWKGVNTENRTEVLGNTMAFSLLDHRVEKKDRWKDDIGKGSWCKIMEGLAPS